MADPYIDRTLDGTAKPVRFTTAVEHTGFAVSVPKGVFYCICIPVHNDFYGKTILELFYRN